MTGLRGNRPQDVVEAALTSANGRDCVVLVEESSTANLRWAMSSLTTNGATSGQSVTVAVMTAVEGGTGVGVVRRRGVGVGQVGELVAQAAAVAAGGGPAEDAAPLVAGPVSKHWDTGAAVTEPSVLAGVADGLGEVFDAARSGGREAFGFALHEVATTWLGTSAGTRVRHVQPSGTIELTGKSHARSRSTWVGRGTRDFSDVDVVSLDAQIQARLAWQERTVDLPAGRYDTVLPPEAVADLMVYLYWSADARSAHEGRSVFSRPGGGTMVGERICSLPFTLASDPRLPGLECAPSVMAGGSSPFASVFDNGLASPAQVWVDAGVVAHLPTTRHTAALTGLPLAPAVDNLALTVPEPQGALADLVAGIERGLLVTCLWYVREVDPLTLLLTGLTRDGVYLVEGGEVTAAVPNYRFNESPVDVLARSVAVGDSRPTLSREWGEYFTRSCMPALRVEGFNMSSVSEAF